MRTRIRATHPHWVVLQQVVSRFLKQARESIREPTVGNRYSDETKVEHKALVNHLALAVETFSVHMIPQRPQVNITSDYPDHKPTAATLKVAINHEIEEMNLEYVLEEIILNAWLRMGVAKIGYSSGNYMRVGNDMIDQGQLFVQSVSLDNWVHDMSCNDFSPTTSTTATPREGLKPPTQ